MNARLQINVVLNNVSKLCPVLPSTIIKNFSWKTLRELVMCETAAQMADGGGVLLKWMLDEYSVTMWIRFNRLKIFNDGIL
jgi:hypothetical protein